MKKYILGINWEQNSSASLFCNKKCLGALSNERISRKKNDESYPREAIDYLLQEFGVKPKDIECVVFVSTHWSPAWILSRHYTSFSTKDYLKEQNEIWYPLLYRDEKNSPLEVFEEKLDTQQYPGEKFWLNEVKKLKGKFSHGSNSEVLELGRKLRKSVVELHLGKINVMFMDHSSCHNSYAYFSQPNRTDNFLSISLDAFGDDINYSAKIYKPTKSGVEIKNVVKGNQFIIGRLYRYITLILGLKPNEHEYKVMGLAPYCKAKYFTHILEMFKQIQDVDGLNFVYLNRPKDHFFEIREKLFSERFDSIAGAIQAYTEYLVSNWVGNLIKETGVRNICYAGGVAMNVKANMVISKMQEVKDFHVPPCPDDTSQSIGAVYEYLVRKGTLLDVLSLPTPYLGREANENKSENKENLRDFKKIISIYCKKNEFSYIQTNYIKIAAKLLIDGKILGLIWGREEFGARALGNRSIIANPSNMDVKKKINEMIKDRDFWMPFAASILESHASKYLELDGNPRTYAFMTNTCNSTEIGKEKFRAAIHPYDETCRPHVVATGSNPKYEKLIKEFGDLSGTYGLLNTSLNLHGSPICSTYNDAIHVMINSNLDGLLIDGALILKNS